MKWIPCNERLPEELKDGSKIVIYTSFENGEITDSIAKYYGKKPLAWMPIPAPYLGK